MSVRPDHRERVPMIDDGHSSPQDQLALLRVLDGLVESVKK
jgi:hypothetical protein